MGRPRGFDKRLWRSDCFDAIAAFADAELQRSAWHAGTPNPHWSFYEFVQKWHSDFRDGMKPWLDNGGLTAEEAVAMAPLEQALKAYRPPGGDPYAVEAILADPKWAAIVAEAQRTRDRLLSLPMTIEERTALQGQPSWEQFRADLLTSGRTLH